MMAVVPTQKKTIVDFLPKKTQEKIKSIDKATDIRKTTPTRTGGSSRGGGGSSRNEEKKVEVKEELPMSTVDNITPSATELRNKKLVEKFRKTNRDIQRRSGVPERVINRIDKDTGQRIQLRSAEFDKGPDTKRVFVKKNLDTGEETIREFTKRFDKKTGKSEFTEEGIKIKDVPKEKQTVKKKDTQIFFESKPIQEDETFAGNLIIKPTSFGQGTDTSRFDRKTFEDFQKANELTIGKITGEKVGELTTKGLKKAGMKPQAVEFIIEKPNQQSSSLNPQTLQFNRNRQSFVSIINPENVGDVTRNVTQVSVDTGKYFIPFGVGTTLFAADVGRDVSRAGGVRNFVRENPKQAALLGAVGLFAAARPISKFGRRGGKIITKQKDLPVSQRQFNQKLNVLPQNKRGTISQTVFAEREVVLAVDDVGNVISISKAEAKARGLKILDRAGGVKPISLLDKDPALKFLPKEKRIEYLKEAIKSENKNVIILGEKSAKEQLKKNILQTRDVLEKSGISKIEQKEIIKDLFKLQNTPKPKIIMKSESVGSVVPKEQSVIQTSGSMKQKQVLKVKQRDFQAFNQGSAQDSGLGQNQFQLSKQQSKQLDKLKSNQLSKQQSKQDNLQLLNTKTKQLSKSNIKLSTRQKSKQQSKQDTKQESKQENKQNQMFKFITKLRSKQKNEFKQEELSRLNRKSTSKSRPIEELKTKFKTPLISNLKSKVKESSSSSNSFEVFVKKFGEEVSIGKRKSKKGAEELLSRELLGTLRASGSIKRGGQKLRANDIKLGKGFRPSKVNPFSLVQVKGARLGRRSETREIQYFRKGKGLL